MAVITIYPWHLFVLIVIIMLIIMRPSISKSIASRRNRTVKSKNTSALLTFYTEGKQLSPQAEGQVGGMHYSAFAIPDSETLIYRAELPFASKIHLLGVPKHSNIEQISPTGRGAAFEEVILEGDYNNYFRLYCGKGQQVDARYMLDPKAMAFTVDFCRSHSWEIIGSELYFVHTGEYHPEDKTGAFDDIEGFVDQIRPAIEKPLSPSELQAITPYARDRRQSLPCPICQKQMHNKSEYYQCPDHHGVLMLGRYLGDLRDDKLDITHQETPEVERRGNIKCPSCGNLMTQVGYNGASIIIDSCQSCPYRWLDGVDAKQISSGIKVG